MHVFPPCGAAWHAPAPAAASPLTFPLLANSGAAKLLARGLLAAAEPTGLTGLYIMVYLATTLFTASVTNNAAVTIMFPVAYEAALDYDVRAGCWRDLLAS